MIAASLPPGARREAFRCGEGTAPPPAASLRTRPSGEVPPKGSPAATTGGVCRTGTSWRTLFWGDGGALRRKKAGAAGNRPPCPGKRVRCEAERAESEIAGRAAAPVAALPVRKESGRAAARLPDPFGRAILPAMARRGEKPRAWQRQTACLWPATKNPAGAGFFLKSERPAQMPRPS